MNLTQTTMSDFRSRLVTLVTSLSSQLLIRRSLRVTDNVPGRGWSISDLAESSFAQTLTCSTAERDPSTRFSSLLFFFSQVDSPVLRCTVHKFGPFVAHITPAHLPDCSSNFIEVALQVLRLCIAALYHLPNFGIPYTRISSFQSPPRQCILRTPSTCRPSVCCLLCFTSSRISSAALCSSLILRRCLDPFCRNVLVSSSNFSTPSNSLAITMFSDSLLDLSLQLSTQVFSFLFCQQPQLIHCARDFPIILGLGALHL